MDSIPGDRYIGEYARWLRIHESKLGDAAASAAAAKRNAAAKADPSASSLSSTFWNVVSLGAAVTPSTAPAPAARPMLLRQNPHNLFYLLIRFEELSLPVGSLDTSIPSSARPTSYFSFVSATPSSKRIDDTMSISSMRSRISVVSSSLNSSLSWFSPTKPDPAQDLKYIYSCFTKIPSLRLGPVPPRRLVQDFEDCPGQSAVPLDVFRNLQMLELEEVDPSTLMGWDRVCVGLRGLTCRRSGVEDLTGLLVGLVVGDARRRRGENVDAKPSGNELSASTTTSTDTDTESAEEAASPSSPDPIPTLPPDLPSFAWHSLRYLNLSSNALTSIPLLPLLPLTSLTHLDLSSNLLNSIPPSLSHLPTLTSLNIADNLIDSVLGIYHSIPRITVLNLSSNRLESLCGVERLFSLQRIDLRHNSIYEAGEVGRLAVLKGLEEVWVGSGNALVEEYVDWRVECFVEFAREGRETAVKLDGEGLGWWEAQRVRERLPAVGGRKEQEGGSKRSEKEEEAQLAKDAATTSGVVRNVRRAQSKVMETARGRGGDLLGVQGAGSESRSRSVSRTRTSGGQIATSAAARRRNQRVVELESSPQKPSTATRQRTLTESDRIKQAALARDAGAAVEAEPGSGTESSSKTLGKGKAVDVGGASETSKHEKPANSAIETDHSAALAAHSTMLLALPPESLSSKTASSSTKQRSLTNHREAAPPRPTASDLFADFTSSAAQDGRSHVISTPHEPGLQDSVEGKSSFAADGHGNSGKARSDALRRRIEALKSEVGDDWLRLLARGEADERRLSTVDSEAKGGDAVEKNAR